MPEPLRLVEPDPEVNLDEVNRALSGASPEAVLEWARQTFQGGLVLTSSFGAESALMLHLVSHVIPRVPVIFIDTGYLFPETYRFAEELTARFRLDVRVYAPKITAAHQEALYGKLWEGDEDNLRRYHEINKIEPMDRALRELGAKAWIAGLRRSQTEHRKGLRPVERQGSVYKVHPILDLDDEEVFRVMRKNDLPFHPLYRYGYRSIGDAHSTSPTQDGTDARAGRHLGEKKECGIHLPRPGVDRSLRSSGL